MSGRHLGEELFGELGGIVAEDFVENNLAPIVLAVAGFGDAGVGIAGFEIGDGEAIWRSGIG